MVRQTFGTAQDGLIDANGQATTWHRDLRGRVTREVRADGTTETLYTFEPRSGRLSTVTDPKGPAFAKATAGLAVVADDRGATEAAR